MTLPHSRTTHGTSGKRNKNYIVIHISKTKQYCHHLDLKNITISASFRPQKHNIPLNTGKRLIHDHFPLTPIITDSNFTDLPDQIPMYTHMARKSMSHTDIEDTSTLQQAGTRVLKL